jgi:hypothetical protein
MSLVPTKQEARAFVGSNTDYYLRAWRRALITGRGGASGFNFAAFLFTSLWLCYRKMYTAAFIVFGIGLVLFSLIAGVIAACLIDVLRFNKDPQYSYLLVILLVRLALGLLWFMVIGFGANRWYWSRAKRVIAQVRGRGHSEDVHLNAIASRGGTDSLVCFFFVMSLLVLYVVFGALFHSMFHSL